MVLIGMSHLLISLIQSFIIQILGGFSLMDPSPPPRVSSVHHMGTPKVTFHGAQTWRSSLAAFSSAILLGIILLSLLLVGIYSLKDRGVVEELFDYLDKTVSISKINYNHALGLFRLNSSEMTSLSQHKSYRTLLSCFLFSDLASLVFIVFILLIFFTSDLQSGKLRIVYWVLLLIGSMYFIFSTHLLVFLLLPYSSTLSNSSHSLLDRSIPHNPGGLQQMENRFGCTFDLNLYAAFKRRANPKNTCDDYIDDSFLPDVLLFFLLFIRLLPFILFVLLIIKRTPLSEAIAQFMENRKSTKSQPPKRLYIKKQHYRNNPLDYSKSPGASVLKDTRPSVAIVPPPVAPSPGIDHSISYNNAAYLATSGLNTSRSSELSRIEDIHLFKGATHYHSGSIMSDV
ncbi:hypothetical protein PMAYCL1PPCAC_06966 [Pristionchus mayeri]|uniref:Uncharacterized protein n=1 Tax=Pristionchus mayeri TaxID=1317129 RepID=A0AAN5CCV0_9BILA|nr:hypothetical protein PMAYCL1PPCAC_06966 [Pristionchus mayeri]